MEGITNAPVALMLKKTAHQARTMGNLDGRWLLHTVGAVGHNISAVKSMTHRVNRYRETFLLEFQTHRLKAHIQPLAAFYQSRVAYICC